MRLHPPQFVAMFANFGHGRISSNHRHDAFVEIVERLCWLSRNVQEEILGAPFARLLRNRAKLGKRFTVFALDVGKIS
jgi:hypothetical protein